jgi:hypothetical protein
MLDEGSQIHHIFVDAPLARRTLTLAMAATIVGQHLESVG